jgi:hypothetical protein
MDRILSLCNSQVYTEILVARYLRFFPSCSTIQTNKNKYRIEYSLL